MAQAKAGAGSRKGTAVRGKKPIRREVGAACCLLLGIFTLIGYFVQDYWLIDAFCLYIFKGLFGWGFLVVPPVFFWTAYILFFHHGRPVKGRLIAIAFIPLLFGAIIHLFACDRAYGVDWLSLRSLYLGGRNMETAGLIGGFLATVLVEAVSMYAAAPILFFGLVTLIFVGGKVSLRRTVDNMKNRDYPAYEPEPEPVKKGRKKARVSEPQPEHFSEYQPVPSAEIFRTEEPRAQSGGRKRRKAQAIDIPMDEELPDEPIPEMPRGPIYYGPDEVQFSTEPSRETRKASEGGGKTASRRRKTAAESPFILDDTDRTEETMPLSFSGEAAEIREPRQPVSFVPPETVRPQVSRQDVDQAAGEIVQAIEDAEAPAQYEYPPVELLRPGSGIQSDGREEVELNRDRLEATLHSFGIGASICDITRGPTVTRYDLELEAGVKLNKLTNLAGDLALSLGVVSVRIAPIPDKISTVGVEVPNKIISTVLLRDIVDSAAFHNASSRLSFAIGKDIGGNCIVGNISKLPHMLIAGTTGSGKSVCMNSLILSLLYKATPDEVRLIMIDPKMVELGIYNGIPHLYIPVVTDPKKAAGSLQWAVVEMMKRYRLFSEVGVRDLNGYNNYKRKCGEETLPNVVIVIDELADLMMTAAKEVEESICRVAQMGRAAGMHLIIATQRPSADVITGLMKANIPSRIAFAVSSSLESRIILDQQGAEKLIGMGDMLYSPLGCGKPLRVQGAFVSDEEREDVINFIKQDATANYDDEILRHIEKAAAGDKNGTASEHDEEPEASEGNPFGDCDALLPQAVDVILDTKQASVSMLQRRLKLGYSRAARIVDEMEELGIVGPFEGSKPRQLLITREQWQEMSMNGRTPLERLIEDQKDDFSEDTYI